MRRAVLGGEVLRGPDREQMQDDHRPQEQAGEAMAVHVIVIGCYEPAILAASAIISAAASAALTPAWPWAPPARARACSSVLVVSTPKMTGMALVRATC